MSKPYISAASLNVLFTELKRSFLFSDVNSVALGKLNFVIPFETSFAFFSIAFTLPSKTFLLKPENSPLLKPFTKLFNKSNTSLPVFIVVISPFCFGGLIFCHCCQSLFLSVVSLDTSISLIYSNAAANFSSAISASLNSSAG